MLFKIIFFITIFYIFHSLIKNSTFQEFIKSVVYGKKEPIELKDEFSIEEKFALLLGDLEHESIVKSLQRMSLKSYLHSEYGVDFSENKEKTHTLYALQKIWREGTVNLFFKHPNLHKYVSVRDMVALDSVRFAELLRQALSLKFMKEEEAWGLLFLNAQRVQDSYIDWEDFKNSYFRGATFMKYHKLHKNNNFNFEKELEKVKQNSKIKGFWIDEEIFSHIKIEDNIKE